MVTYGSIERQSIGAFGTIGALYDARTDTLEGTNLFNKTLPDTLVKTIDYAHSKYEIDLNNSQRETFNKLNIEASLRLSLLGGLVDISGSAKYLKQTKTDERTVRVTLIGELTTKREYLEISMDELHNYFTPNALENPHATHVVTGIIWGAKVAATFEQRVENKDVLQKSKAS